MKAKSSDRVSNDFKSKVGSNEKSKMIKVFINTDLSSNKILLIIDSKKSKIGK